MPNLVRRLLDGAAAVRRPAPYVPPHFPERGDPVEAWLWSKRNSIPDNAPNYARYAAILDDLLHDYQQHADAGSALDAHVCRADGDGRACLGCFNKLLDESSLGDSFPAPQVSDAEMKARIAAALTEVRRRKESKQ